MRLLPARASGFVGMNDSAVSTDDYGPGEIMYLANARVVESGGIEGVYGYQRLLRSSTLSAPSALGTGVGRQVVAFTTAGGTKYFIAFQGTKAYRASTSDLTSWSEIATGLTSAWWSTATFRSGSTNYLLAVNGTDRITYDGTTWATWTNCPSGAKYVVTANDRAWVSGHSGNTVQASKVNDHTTFTTGSSGGLSLVVQTYDGDDAVTALGVLGAQIVVGKSLSTAIIDGYGAVDLLVAAGARGASRSVGCIAGRTMVPVGDHGLAWLSSRGIELWRGPGSQIEQIGKGTRRHLDAQLRLSAFKSDRGLAHACWYEHRNELWMTVPLSSSTWRTHIIRMDTGGAWLRTWASGGMPAHIINAPPAFDTSNEANPPLFGITYEGHPCRFEIGGLDHSYFTSVTSTYVGDATAGTAYGRLEEYGTERKKRARMLWVLGGYADPLDMGLSGTGSCTVGVRSVDGSTTTTSSEAVTFTTASSSDFTARGSQRKRVPVNLRGVQPHWTATLKTGLWLSSVEMQAEVLEQSR